MFFFSFSNNIISEIEIKVKFIGAYSLNRTDALRFTRPLLYQLSYIGIRSGTHLRGSRRLISGWVEDLVGWASRSRTCDLLINSQPLYQLSYIPILCEPFCTRPLGWFHIYFKELKYHHQTISWLRGVDSNH